MSRSRGRRAAFTLVALLTVTAIIATLAAILLPVFARAREQARAAMCVSNLSNIAIGLKIYAEDHAGLLPPREDDLGPLYPRYLATSQIFRCPSKSDTVCSYIYNIYLNNRADAEIAQPAQTVTIADSTGNGWWGIDGSTMATYGHPNCRIKDMNKEGANFGFCDGHAKWQKRENWLPSQWYPTWTP